MNLFFLFLLFFTTTLFGLDVKYCTVTDDSKHEANQKLLSTILEKELTLLGPNKTAAEQANYLNSRIFQIAKTLMQKGFASDAYRVPDIDENSVVSFNHFSLWEGDNKKIPLTFFVYVWPSEEWALKYNTTDPLNSRYGSIIHSHPISCAFAVLKGSLSQKNYERITFYPIKRMVSFIDEEQFHLGEGSIDDLKSPFIHQLYSKGTGSTPALSLHVYGLSSEEKVMQCFQDTYNEHAYNYELQKTGAVKISFY